MKDLKNRLNKIEEKAGVCVDKDYLFIFICHPYRVKPFSEVRKPLYKKGNSEGMLIIYEKQGEYYDKRIDVSTDEGKKIAREHGFDAVTNLNIEVVS